MTDDIVDRLRNGYIWDKLPIEAADEIERLRVIVHALEIDYGENADEIERLREELAQLHEAVKPSVLDCTEYCFEECQRGTEPIENCACFKVGVAIAVRERNT